MTIAREHDGCERQEDGEERKPDELESHRREAPKGERRGEPDAQRR